jgi:hypothetical protein
LQELSKRAGTSIFFCRELLDLEFVRKVGEEATILRVRARMIFFFLFFFCFFLKKKKKKKGKQPLHSVHFVIHAFGFEKLFEATSDFVCDGGWSGESQGAMVS